MVEQTPEKVWRMGEHHRSLRARWVDWGLQGKLICVMLGGVGNTPAYKTRPLVEHLLYSCGNELSARGALPIVHDVMS